MKKIVLAFMLMSSLLLTAQSPYHRGDTIVGRTPRFLYQPYWSDPGDSILPPAPPPPVPPVYVDNNFLASYRYKEYGYGYYTDTMLRVYGVAFGGDADYEGVAIYENPDIANWRESVKIYSCVEDSFVSFAEKSFGLYDTTCWMRSFDNPWYSPRVKTGFYSYNGYYPIFEVLFDNPVDVIDSFFVTITNNSCMDTSHTDIHLRNYAFRSFMLCASYYGYREYLDSVDPSYARTKIIMSPDNFAVDKDQCHAFGYMDMYNTMHCINFMFPIIDTTGMNITVHCDTCDTCGMVANFRLDSVWGNSVLLSWDSTEGQTSWQLAVGRADADSAGYRTFDAPVPSRALHNLEYNTVYAARVRAKCNSSSYSEWSDTIQFIIPQPEGIDAAEDGHIFILPNPAVDKMMVYSSYTFFGVELYDLNGRKVLMQNCNGNPVTIDVSSCAEGTYIAVVRTSAGTYSQKVTIGQ